MAPLKLYYDNLSQPSRALEIFLRTTNIEFEPNFVHLAKGEHLTEEYEKINPFKKVPVIDDNGFLLTESVAILRYLCREKNVADHWYPKDSKQQARVDEYLEWQHLETRASCALYFRTKYLIPLLNGKAPDEKYLSFLKKRMLNACDSIENVWLKDKPFIAGQEISIADLLAAAELEQLHPTGYDPKVGRPLLAAWLSRVRNFTNPFYDEVHKRIRKLKKISALDSLSKL